MSQTISLESPVTSPTIRPGWPEILSGVVAFVMVGFGGGAWLVQSKLDPIIIGLTLAALSGFACLVGFAVAALVRIRSWSAFGVRPVPLRWLAIGAGAGLVAFIAKGFAIVAFVALTGQDANPQDIYATGASGGISTVILSILFLGILTPIGEEFLFRGVVANALLRYGPFIGVVGSAVIFALLHGINMIFPAALVAGLITAEVFRRSGSVWPGVIVHVVFNFPLIPMMLLAQAA